MAIAFSPSCFMEYALSQKRFHEFAAYPEEVKVLDKALRGEGGYEAEREVDLDRIGSHGRREVVRAVMERLGQENFRARVLAAYRRHCAMCGLQLDLVVAAHIVPVNVKGTNETSNGLTLCFLHHEAYDRAFVVADDEYRIRVNEAATERLRRLKRNSKEEEFRQFLRSELFLPERQQDRPSPAYLRRGMQLRGWPTALA
jgi:putative restriction endonuclease